MAATNTIGRLAAIAAAAFACLVATGSTGETSARVCRQLERELAGAGSGGGGGGQVRKYDAAIDRQRQQLSIARSQARAAGCGFSLFGAGVRQCASLNATIARMNDNLDDLQSKRGQLGGGGKSKSRARLLASLEANGCRDVAAVETPRERKAEEKRRREIMLGDIVQEEPEAPEGERAIKRVIDPENGGGLADLGSYRTVCVRTCDGYYFPMSPASSRGDFDRDRKNCESTCPGTEMQVYYHDNQSTPQDAEGEPTEDSAALVSAVDGRPYTELDTAYLYRKDGAPRPQSCGCNVAKNFSVIAGTPPADQLAPETATPSIVGDDAPKAEATPAEPPAKTPPPEIAQEDRKVRVVGPEFLPDPAAAINLRAPAPTQVR